jgi:hypothetical protein
MWPSSFPAFARFSPKASKEIHMSPLLPRRRVPSPRARFLRLSFASMGSNEKHLLLCLSPLSVPVIVCLFGLLQTGARDVARKVAPLVAPGRLTSPRAAASLRAANVCAQITGFTCQATHAESRQVYSVRDRRFYEQWEVSVQADPVDYRRGSRAQYQIIFDAADLRIRTLNRVQEEEDANAADPVIAEEQAPRPQGGRSSQMSRAQRTIAPGTSSPRWVWFATKGRGSTQVVRPR